MDNQNNSDKHGFSMMIMMMACCILPILIISIFGVSLGGSQKWLILGGMTIFMIAHFIIMSKSHGNHDSKPDKDNTGGSKKHGCH